MRSFDSIATADRDRTRRLDRDIRNLSYARGRRRSFWAHIALVQPASLLPVPAYGEELKRSRRLDPGSLLAIISEDSYFSRRIDLLDVVASSIRQCRADAIAQEESGGNPPGERQ